MDPLGAMRTIGANRFYLEDDVPDEVIYRAADSARFAPQGGNRNLGEYSSARKALMKATTWAAVR